MKEYTRAKLLKDNIEFENTIKEARRTLGLPENGLRAFDVVVDFLERRLRKRDGHKLRYRLGVETEKILKEFNLSQGWGFSIWKYIIEGRRLTPGEDIWLEVSNDNGILTVKICIGKWMSVRSIRKWLEGEGNSIIAKKLKLFPKEPQDIKDLDLKRALLHYRSLPKPQRPSFSKLAEFWEPMYYEEYEVAENEREKRIADKRLKSISEQNLKEGYYNYKSYLKTLTSQKAK